MAWSIRGPEAERKQKYGPFPAIRDIWRMYHPVARFAAPASFRPSLLSSDSPHLLIFPEVGQRKRLSSRIPRTQTSKKGSAMRLISRDAYKRLQYALIGTKLEFTVGFCALVNCQVSGLFSRRQRSGNDSEYLQALYQPARAAKSPNFFTQYR